MFGMGFIKQIKLAMQSAIPPNGVTAPSKVVEVPKNHPNAIPNAQNAVIPEAKIKSYSLNPDHPHGGHKARVFESALGFNKNNADLLIQQIKAQLPNVEAVSGEITPYGKLFTVDMPITGPNGKTAIVRTGWIIKNGTDIPNLTTAYVR